MAGFDPSVISSIPDGFDSVGSVQRAYTLKGLADEAQLNKLRLNQVRQDQTDQARLRDILKTSSYSNPDGVMKTAEKITQAGMPEEAMKFMQTAQSYQAGEVERQVNQLRLADAQQDAIAGALDGVYGQLEQMRVQGATPAMLDAAAAKLIIPAMQNLAQQNPQVRSVVQKFAQNPQNLTYNGIRSAEAASNRGQQMLKSRLAELSENTRERQENERERHDQAMESNARTRETDKVSRGAFSEDEGALMAALAERGVSLPTGFRSKDQQKALYSGILARNPNRSPDEIADLIAKGQISFGAEKKATSTAAGIAGRTGVAENEILDMAGPLLQASDAVPRGKFVPVNKLLQMSDASLSDPALKTLKVRINAMLNAYDQLAARGGTDKNKREEAHSLLLSAESPEALRAGVDAFRQEASIAKGAAERAAGLPSSSQSARSAGSALPPTNAQGWQLMQDAQGNKAYVSPDGKQFQQVQ